MSSTSPAETFDRETPSAATSVRKFRGCSLKVFSSVGLLDYQVKTWLGTRTQFPERPPSAATSVRKLAVPLDRSVSLPLSLSLSLSLYIYIYICIYIYIYMCIEREREIIHVYVCMCIYIYIERERYTHQFPHSGLHTEVRPSRLQPLPTSHRFEIGCCRAWCVCCVQHGVSAIWWLID